MRFSKAVDEYYNYIYKQGIEICKNEKDRSIKVNLMEILARSKMFCLKNPEYFLLTTYIYCIVSKWDDFHKRNGHKCRHSFVIVSKDMLKGFDLIEKYSGTIALLFNHHDGPDDRIIAITVDDRIHISKNIDGIMHEVGHYVGCRKRKWNNKQEEILRSHYHIALAVQDFLRTIFSIACTKLINSSRNEIPRSIVNDNTYNTNKQEKMRTMLNCLGSDIFYRSLVYTLSNEVERVKTYLIGIKQNTNDKHAYELEYMDKMIECINKAFYDFLSSVSHIDRIKRILRSCAETQHLEMNELSILLSAFDEVVENRDKIDKKDSEFNWGGKAGNLLEEVAADVFMVRILDMQNRYLYRILRVYDYQNADSNVKKRKNYSNESDIVKDVLIMSNNRARIVCVQAACQRRLKRKMYGHKKHQIAVIEQFHNMCERLNDKLDSLQIEDRNGDIVTTFEKENFLRNEYCLRIMNPCITAGEYTRIIMDDYRYEDFILRSIEEVKQIKGFIGLRSINKRFNAIIKNSWEFTEYIQGIAQ